MKLNYYFLVERDVFPEWASLRSEWNFKIFNSKEKAGNFITQQVKKDRDSVFITEYDFNFLDFQIYPTLICINSFDNFFKQFNNNVTIFSK